MALFLDLVRKEKEEFCSKIQGQLKDWSSFVSSGACNLDYAFSMAISRSSFDAIRIIGEVKPSSPSSKNFELDNSFNVNSFVKNYEHGGVNALSVLTDEKHFSGGYDLLADVRKSTSLPILQKEFVIDIAQMKLGRMNGANAVLLLTHYFSVSELEDKIKEAESVGLEAVVEISIEEELERALKANPKILLINNRAISLLPENPSKSYLEGDVKFSRKIWESRPDLREWKLQKDRVLISASCFESAKDLKHIEDLPYSCILMGNALSKSPSPKEFLRNFKQGNM